MHGDLMIEECFKGYSWKSGDGSFVLNVGGVNGVL